MHHLPKEWRRGDGADRFRIYEGFIRPDGEFVKNQLVAEVNRHYPDAERIIALMLEGVQPDDQPG